MRYSPTRWMIVGSLALALLGPVFPSASGEPDPTPTPTPTPTSTTKTSATSLAEFAARIRLRQPTPKPGEPSSGVTITDENLDRSGSSGAMSLVGSTAAGADEGTDEPGEDEGPDQDKKREFWRSKYRAQQKLIAELEDRIEQLDAEIPRLWNQFYAWDDPAYRDGVIKPELDAKLKERERLTERLPQEREKLDDIVREARRDGAQPGWFRNLDSD